jgi:uncharacterized membrane protein
MMQSPAQTNSVSALRRRPDPHLLALGVAVLVGVVLRVVGLDRQSFWTDELYVVWEGRQPLDVLLNPQLHIQHPPGYRFLLHTWMGISLDETWIRLVPLLAGILLIPVAWGLARLLWPDHPVAGDVAAILVATSPYLLHYSQDVTTYSWTTLWVAISFLLLVAAWRTDRWWLWAAWAVSLAASLYSHYFALFPAIVEGVGVLALALSDEGRKTKDDGRLVTDNRQPTTDDHYALRITHYALRITHSRLGHALAAIAFAFLLYLPWLWQLFGNGGQALGIVFFPLTLDGQAFHWVPVLTAGYAHAPVWQSGWGAWVTWSALALAAGWATWSLYRARDGQSAGGLVLVLGWLAAAIIGPYLFLRITTPPGSIDPVRFASMAAPALLVGLAAVVALVRPALRIPLLAVWLLLVAWQWRDELSAPATQDWRGILATMRQQAQPGDVVLAFPAFHAAAAASYYPIPEPVLGGWFTVDGDDPTGGAYWFPPNWYWRGFLNPVAHRSADWTDEITARAGAAHRIWYLAGDGADGTYPPSPAAERALAALGYHPAEEWRASPLVLKLYTKSYGLGVTKRKT